MCMAAHVSYIVFVFLQLNWMIEFCLEEECSLLMFLYCCYCCFSNDCTLYIGIMQQSSMQLSLQVQLLDLMTLYTWVLMYLHTHIHWHVKKSEDIAAVLENHISYSNYFICCTVKIHQVVVDDRNFIMIRNDDQQIRLE